MPTLTVDSFEELQEVYDSVAEDFNQLDYTDWMVKELDNLARWENDLFVNAVGPDGGAWPPLAASTIRRKGHAAILVDTGALFRSLTARGLRQSTGDAVREAIQTETGGHLSFGTSVPYSVYHDRASGSRPARRHVGINESYLDGMVNRVADYTIEKLTEA